MLLAGGFSFGVLESSGNIGQYQRGFTVRFYSGSSFSLLRVSRDLRWVTWEKCPEQYQETSVLFNLSRELFLASSVEVSEICWLFFRLDPYRPLWEALWNNFKLSQR